MEPDKPEEEKKEEAKPEVKTEAEPKKHVEHHHHKAKIKKTDFWKTVSVVMGILFVIALVTKGFTVLGTDGLSAEHKLSADEASSKAIKYINENLLQEGTTAKIVNVTEMEALYKIKMDIDGREFDSFITKDGKYLFPSGIDTMEEVETPDTTPPPAAANIPKSETPKVQLFVMSQCPFGTIGEAAIKPVVELLGDKIDYELNYIVNEQADGSFKSLHGQPEVDGNIRQLCVEKHFPTKHLDYIACVNENYRDLAGNWERCATENSINSEKIETCWKGEEGKKLLSDNAKIGNELSVGSSPTLIINSQRYSGQRTPEAFKQSICSAFTEPPEGCDEELSAEGNTADGSC